MNPFEPSAFESLIAILLPSEVSPTHHKSEYDAVGTIPCVAVIVVTLAEVEAEPPASANFIDRGEGTFELQAIAHYSVDALSTPPFTIYLDKTTSPTSAVALSSIAPANGSTGAVATVVLTFNNAISTENVFITLASDGSIVAGTKAWDSTRKILTFTPTTAFAAAKYYVNIVSVVDIYGQTLANTITDFTVA